MQSITAVGEQRANCVSYRAWKRLARSLSVVTISLFLVMLSGLVCPDPLFAQDEMMGLDTPVAAISVQDQKLPEFAQLLSELAGLNINVAGSVDSKLTVTMNLVTTKTVREILEDLASQYSLWVDIQGKDVMIRPESERPQAKETILEKTFVLRFSRPSEIIDLVRNFLSDRPQADVIALDTEKALLVRDIPEALARIEEFITRTDIPQQSVVFRVLYRDVEEVASIIFERIPDLEENALTVDVVNSQIFARTTLEKLTEIQLLIESLDVHKEIRVFNVGFHEAEDVLAILEDLELLSLEAKVAVNEFTGKIIIQDIPERLDLIEDAIQAYDQPRPLVFVEAEVLEVNADYNFEWNPQMYFSDAAKVDDASGSGLLDGETILRLAGSGSFEFAALDAGKVLASLKATESDSDTHIVASPRVLVARGEEARLNVGSEEPYGVRSSNYGYYGGSSSADYYTQRVREVGVRLIIYARNISEKGYVELEVGVENSSLMGRVDIGGDGTTGLRVATTNIETVAMIKDGRTLALGGLLKRDQKESSGGIPFLNRVPLIRYLFSDLSRSDSRKKLLLFITPHIMNIDTPYHKFMTDDTATYALHQSRGDLSVADVGTPDTYDSRWSIKDEPQWVNRGDRWGYVDDRGNFVDQTDLFMSAYDQPEDSAGSRTDQGVGSFDQFEEKIQSDMGSHESLPGPNAVDPLEIHQPQATAPTQPRRQAAQSTVESDPWSMSEQDAFQYEVFPPADHQQTVRNMPPPEEPPFGNSATYSSSAPDDWQLLPASNTPSANQSIPTGRRLPAPNGYRSYQNTADSDQLWDEMLNGVALETDRLTRPVQPRVGMQRQTIAEPPRANVQQQPAVNQGYQFQQASYQTPPEEPRKKGMFGVIKGLFSSK